MNVILIHVQFRLVLSEKRMTRIECPMKGMNEYPINILQNIILLELARRVL